MLSSWLLLVMILRSFDLLVLSHGVVIISFLRGTPILWILHIVYLLLILIVVSWPVDSVSQRLSTSAKDWEWPKPFVYTKNLVPVIEDTDVINTSELLVLLVQVFNCIFV
jgi:ABC-type amino acid transport system permease subunit